MPKSRSSSVFMLGAAIVCTSVVAAALTLSTRSWVLPKRTPVTSLPSKPQAQPQGPSQFFQVWVHRNEIMPDLIYARPGRALLRAENETGGDIELLVERLNQNQANTPQASIRTVNKAKRASQEVVLQPGEYVYFSAVLPQLKGRLIVVAR
ncbi:MAG: hypothetical protein HYR56_33705 [Acidobacteria bacterium]|nr:hypothetical protein [Acidobacteriota bacterium]MBI3422916.1 hypothetical protein [Acidobacteriota bacterium]